MRLSGGIAPVYNYEGSFAWRTLFTPLFVFSFASIYYFTAFEQCPERSFTVDSWDPSSNSLEHIVALPECPVICLPVVSIFAALNISGKKLLRVNLVVARHLVHSQYINSTLKACAVDGMFSYNSVDSFTITNPAASHCKRH